MREFERLQYLIGLTLIEGVGHVLAKRLVAYCGSPQEVFNEKASRLTKVPGVGDFIARMVTNSSKVLEKAERELAFCEKHKIKVLGYFHEDYPHRLGNCEDGPAFLFVQGQANLNASRMINIVGTRNASAYGKNFTEKLVEDLAPYGVSVVSGMAFGIDITTHKTCLAQQVPTIGVVAHGMHKIYPAAHSHIANQMVNDKGAIITEFLSDAEPDKENFPRRNRIVAGMCDATIVIETGLKGGSMITARLANDYNRDVFALPGRPNEEKSKGCNFMIKSNRAALFESAEDIIQLMGWQQAQAAKPVQISLPVNLTDEEKMIAGLLAQQGKLMLDKISLSLEQPVSRVSVTLLNLEFKGAIRALPGKVYELV